MNGQHSTLRRATIEDIDDLVQLRRLMFESMGWTDQEALDAGDAASRAYLLDALPSGEFQGWLAVTPEGKAVCSGGAVIDQHPPGPNNLSGKTGYIMNIVTLPEYRRRGLARQMMQTILNWFTSQHIQRIVLHASDMGRPLYEQLGFSASNEMRLMIPPQP